MKKIASLLISVALLAAMLTVFAVPALAATAEVVQRFTRGDRAWTLYTDGSMVVSGDMMVIGLDQVSWHSNRSMVKSVTMENSVTVIGRQEYYDCFNMISLSIPDSVTSIGESAFQKCLRLASVTIPNSVTKIGNAAFSECNALKELILSDNITSIGKYTFDKCFILQSVTIPFGVTSIDDYAFEYCYELSQVTVLAKMPPKLGKYVFRYLKGKDTEIYSIYVPADSVSKYKTASGWSEYADFIKPIPSDDTADLGSTLSDGSIAIITAVVGIAVGMAVMFFIMKKKSPHLQAQTTQTKNNT